MCTHLSDHDCRLSNLEKTLLAMKSSLRKTQAASSELGTKQSKISSEVNLQENVIGNLNQETLVSSKRVKDLQPSMHNRMGELGNRTEETRGVNMDAGIPWGVIQSLNNTILGGARSAAIELLSQQVNDLTQVSCTDQALSADLRTEFSELQERINLSVSLPAAATLCPMAKSSRMILGEVKAREREIVRKGIDRLEMQIKQYTSVYVSKDQVNIGLIKKCKTTDILALNSAVGNIQKALQGYVGFDGMDPDYCDRIEELMDRAQAWVQDIEEIHNKAEVHSINAS